MNKSIIMGAALIAAVTLASCGTSKESAYRKAYEKAKAQEQQEQVYEQAGQETKVETPVVTPLVEQPATSTVAENVDNVSVRQENLSVVDGEGLKAYSVVVGAYGVKANATGLKQRLIDQGNAAQIAYNAERNVYRVIIGTYANKADAVAKRNAIRATYKDAWILYSK